MHLKKFLLFGLMAAVLPAVAEEAADRKTATSLKYVTHELETRQNKFGVDTNKAMEYTNAAGMVQKRAVTSDLDNGGTESLPMVGGVNTKLNQKQDDIDPVNDHTAVTYTGTAGQIGQKGIYQTTESYAAQSDNLIDAKTFNAALKNGLDSEFKCRDYKPDTDLCWVYSIHNPTTDNTLLPPGYTPLEWIESDGHQYIDTGLTSFKNTDVLKMKIRPTNVTSTTFLAFQNPSSGLEQQGLFLAESMLKYQYGRASRLMVPVVVNTDYTIEATNGRLVVNGVAPTGELDPEFTINYNLLIATAIDNNTPEQRMYSGRIYYFRYEDKNGNVLFNGIPSKNSADKVGMYDMVSGQFFPSIPANTNFAAGPESNDTNLYIPQNQ